MWCKLCLLFTETQQHLLECPVIRIKTKHLINFIDFSYDMIFGNIGNQETIAKKYQIILKARDDILESNEWDQIDDQRWLILSGGPEHK